MAWFRRKKAHPDFKGNVRSRESRKKEKLKLADKARMRLRPSSSFLVTMLFSNGTSRQFVVSTGKETFTYKGRTYFLRYEDAWFDLSYNQYRLMYFDDYPCPIDRKVTRKGDKSFWSVTAANLKPLIKMEYIKALAQAQELSRYLKMAMLFSILSTAGCIIIIALVYK